MRNLIPKLIETNFAVGNYRGEFSAVGLFLDISGFSTMMDDLMTHGPHGAEVLANVMGAIFTPLAASIFAQGGFIAGLAGDAFTALFPIDDDVDAAVRRALAASLAIQDVMQRSGGQQTPYGAYQIQAKVGLALGQAAWGIVTSPDDRRAVYYFQGSAIERSALAEHLASGGQIILDESFYAAAHPFIQVEPLGDAFRLLAAGAPLPAPRPLPAPELDRAIVARFYPESVLDQAFSGEFRQLVSVFISLPAVRNTIQLFTLLQTIFELLDSYGGLFSKLDFGDKGSNVLIIWGMPAAHENDIERALNFILGLQSMTSIPLSAGVTYQIAHAGFIGSPFLEDFTGYGRGINLASRFMTQAPRGEIWTDEGVYRRSQSSFDFELLGAMSFKGFSEAQRVYALLERKPQLERFFTGEMIGRQAELQRLIDFYEPLCAGRYAGALIVFGEAGIGKSRLVHEFHTSDLCRKGGDLWAICQCDEILRAPLNPFRYWLKNYFGQSPLQAEPRNKRNFNRIIDDLIFRIQPVDPALAEELERLRSFLGALVDLHWSDSLYEQLDPLGRHENTLTGLAVLLRAESLLQPVVILLEDIHWLDGGSREFLPRLERILGAEPERSYPLAIIATARPEERAELFGPHLAYQALELGGIAAADLAGLVNVLLKAPPSPAFLAVLARQAEGNPFYAEQIVRYLLEQGYLELVDDAWDLNVQIEGSLLPGDVRAILAARLDRLTQQVRHVIQTAAILGREFELQVLAHMLRDESSLPEKIEAATQAEIWAPIDEIRYIFSHILLQDTAYRMLLRAQRQALHGVAVAAFEAIFEDDLDSHFDALAYHSEQAGLDEKARLYLTLAGEAAGQVFQNQRAIQDYTRALALTPDEALEARFDLLLKREQLNFISGNLEGQQVDLELLAGLVERLAGRGDPALVELSQAQLYDRKAGYALQINDYAQAIAMAEQSVPYACAAGADKVAISAYMTWSSALNHIGQAAQAIEQAHSALELARRSNDLHGQGQSLNMLGNVYWDIDDSQNAYSCLSESLAIGERNGFRRIVAMASTNLGNLAATQGDLIACREYYHRALNITREIGERSKEGIILGNLGWISGMLGDYATAQAYCEQTLPILRAVGDERGVAMNLINLSAYLGRQGDYPAALAYAQQANDLSARFSDPATEAWVLTYRGHAYLGLDQVGPACDDYSQALAIRRRLNQPALATEPLAGLARAALSAGEPEQAQGYVEEILAFLEGGGSLGSTDEPLRVYLVCYQVLAQNHDRRAPQILAAGHDLLIRQADKIDDPVMRRNFLEVVPYHRELLAQTA